MKRIISLVVMVIMLLSVVTACGQNVENSPAEQEPTEIISDTASEMISEDVSDMTSAESETNKAEDTIEEITEPETFELTEEFAIEKINKSYDALLEILKAQNNLEYNIVNALETWGIGEFTDVSTKDGYQLKHEDSTITLVCLGMYSRYFYDYVNNDTGYYSFIDYISSHNLEELTICDKEVIDDGAYDTNVYAMNNCLWLTTIFSQPELTVSNITDNITVNHKTITIPGKEKVEAKFQCDIMFGGEESGFKVLFDENGNMLNINDENVQEDAFEFVNTFPDGV